MIAKRHVKASAVLLATITSLAIVLSACGGGAAPPEASVTAPSTPPASASTEASPAASSSPVASVPAAIPAIQLPPHGDALYQLKIDAAGANVSPRLANPALDKMAVVDQTLEMRAAPKGSVGLELPGVQADNFVLAARLRPVTGDGSYSLSFHRERGSDYPYVRVTTASSTVGIAQASAADNKFVKWLAQPQIKWPKSGGEDVWLALSVLGPDAVAYVNGAEAARAKVNASNKGPIIVNAFGPTDGDVPFVSQLVELQVFAADPAASGALTAAAAPAASLPPHGDLAYELKIDPPRANITVNKRKPDDKVEVAPGGVDLTAAPGSNAEMILPDLTLDDFVANIRLRPSAGEGNFAFAFHGTQSRAHSVAVFGGTGQLALMRLAIGTPTPATQKPVTNLFGPALALAPDSQEEISLVVSAQGADIAVLLNGKEAAKVSDPGAKGLMLLSVVNPPGAKKPYTARVIQVKVYQGAKA